MKVFETNLFNSFQRKIKRAAQVMLPKDIAMILAYTAVPQKCLIVDAGTGSGYLTIFLAYYFPNGKIVTYEKDRRFWKNIQSNFRATGLKNIRFKKKDFARASEKNANLITLDLEKSEKFVDKAYKMLCKNGWLTIYSPTADSLIRVRKKLLKKNFAEIKTVENIVREWQMTKTVRPKTVGLMHTGFLTFARKA